MLFDGAKYAAGPASDIVEVTLIGPGYGFGESVLVHVGDGEWHLIDSCSVPQAPDPLPLSYLADIGVAPTSVRSIVASHWDDDHVRGLARTVERCTNADFVLAPTFTNEEFIAFAGTEDVAVPEELTSGARELFKTLNVLERMNRMHRVQLSGPSKRLYSLTTLSHGQTVEIWSLSPSDDEMTNFLLGLAKQFPGDLDTRRAPVKRIRNKLTSVMWISVGESRVLLGGDLEEDKKPQTGWSAILLHRGRPTEPCSVFKVPHHGSITGHHPDVWRKMLRKNPVALLAPWAKGRGALPKKTDVQRISQATPHSYISSTGRSRKVRPRNPVIRKAIAATNHRTFEPNIGIVRLRRLATARAGQQWKVELFGSAIPLKNFNAA